MNRSWAARGGVVHHRSEPSKKKVRQQHPHPEKRNVGRRGQNTRGRDDDKWNIEGVRTLGAEKRSGTPH